MPRILYKLLFLTFFALIDTKMMRNNALISKMVSNFQKDKYGGHYSDPDKDKQLGLDLEPQGIEHKHQSTQLIPNIVAVMQRVLCNNFPLVPCSLITSDATLKQLIDQSIQQIRHKNLLKKFEPSTTRSYHTTKYPVASEDLSSFLKINDKGYFSLIEKKSKHHQKHEKEKSENDSKSKKHNRRKYGGKKLRQIYAQREKEHKNGGSSEEKVLISDDDMLKLGYTADPANKPVWKVEYTRQGTPNFMFAYERDRFQEKMVKNPPDGLLEERPESKRKDVLHPDLYIKKNFVRQNDVGMTSALLVE